MNPLGALVVLGAACWLCIYPVALVLVGLFVLVLVPQGAELLEATAIQDSVGNKLVFHASVAIWAYSAWYCSRVLLQRRFQGRFASPSLDSNDAFTLYLRIWMPRLLGGAIYAALAAKFLLMRELTDGVLMLIGGLVYAVVVVYRRGVLAEMAPAAERRDELGRVTRSVLAVALALSYALFVAFMASPVDLPRWLGAAPIMLFAFTSWILFGSLVLVLLPKAYGWPSLALLPIVLAMAAGNVDNHEIRLLPASAAAPRAATIQAAAREWLDRRETEFRLARARGDEFFPVYIVAAEGGGVRAAYWTGNVLGELDRASDSRFGGRVFAISSVSGGSLGAAAFAAQLATPEGCNSPEKPDVRNCVRHFLRGDFLAPLAAYLLFPDMVQRFLPFMPVRAFDRARALELSWERSWSETHPLSKSNLFAGAYDELSRIGGALPYLFFNGARVETGKRALVSPARFDEDELPDVDDLFAVGDRPWTTPVSTAVHLSARFTYVSPAAKICRNATDTCGFGEVWGRVVDGGYHENSGAQTAQSLLRALRRAAREFQKAQPPGRTAIQPQVVIISNDVGSTRLCDPARTIEPAHWFAEMLSPAVALWNSRIARGAQARRALADAAAGPRRDPLEKDCAGDRSRANTFEFSIASADQQEKAPALGWFLAVGSTRRMDQTLCRGDHLQAIERVRRDLGATTPYSCEAG